jgi:hypothetical protein
LANPLAAWRQRKLHRTLEPQIARVERYLEGIAGARPADSRPVLFFNASTRIHRLSLNGAFGLLASWAVRAHGAPVLQLICRQGMDQCILGTDRRNLAGAPPCRPCIELSEILFPGPAAWLPLRPDIVARVESELRDRPLSALASWQDRGLPLGQLCLPGLRWALRRHHLPDTEAIRSVFRRYLASAASLAAQVEHVMDESSPRALVVFNGIFFPEAVAREVARSRNVPVVTHEVGLRPASAFFSHREATFRQMDVAAGVTLTPEQNEALDRYLEDRFRGRFTMAGVKFWDGMSPLPEWLKTRAGRFRGMVVVFGNVVFDTSQVHAHTLFEDMFAWLEAVALEVESRPDLLFVLRAHPDEDRPGKESQESMAAWVRARGLLERDNVVFVPPGDRISSYELIRGARLVLVYNSSIGLEASILGTPVLCAGRARYTQIPTVYYPEDRTAYDSMLRTLLGEEDLAYPEELRRNASAYLFHELFHGSLNLSEFLAPDPGRAGMVTFRDFDPARLTRSPALEVIRRGILEGEPFRMGRERPSPSQG